MNFADSLRATAYHEAGHGAAAEHFSGLPATISIWRDRRGLLEGKCVGAPMVPTALPLFAVAGACAEVLADARINSYGAGIGGSLHMRLVAAMSPPDEAMIGMQNGLSAPAFLRSSHGAALFDRGLDLCRQLWLSIDARAQLEIFIFNRREAGVAVPA